EASEDDRFSETPVLREPLDPGAADPVPDQQQPRRGVPGMNTRESVEEVHVSLRASEHGDRPDHGLRQAEALSSCASPVVAPFVPAFAAARELSEVHAGGDGDDAAGVDAGLDHEVAN